MMAFVQCCVLGLLAIVGLQDGNVVTASRDIQCDSITLTSTWRDHTKEEIKDRNGRPVEFTSLEFSSLGKVPCERGENLFVYENKFHVKNGCTARFSFCYKASDSEPPYSSNCKIITLLSKKHREHTEDFDEKIDDISLVEQFKDSAECKRGDNYGTRDKIAFASEGCQGKFKVCFKRTSEDCKIIKLKSRIGSEDIENFDERIEDITVDEQYTESVDCVRGINFGRRDNIAFASDGCRGTFKVCFKKTQEECKRVKLLSRIDRENTETFDEKIDDITVEDQNNEDVPCVKGTNFGIRGKIAYASKGCRGTFKVCFKRTGAYDDCDIVKLRSSLTDQHQYIPTDDDGHPVTIVSVRLMKDLKGSTGCVEDKTYRLADNIVTSRKGCHGKFKICYKKSEPEAGSKGCVKVYLGSTTSYTHRQKVADDSRKIRSFQLWRQEEGIKCIKDTNYGVKGSEIFAKGGCKGYFKLCLNDSLPLPEKEKSTCVNVYLTSYSQHEPDWTTVTDKDGNSVNITEFTLVTEYSRNVCIKGKNYYISESNKVNAKNGCQAKIRVCYKS